VDGGSVAKLEGVKQAVIDAYPWVEVLEGMAIKVLRVAPDGGFTMMLRAQPGFELFTHRHLGEVHAHTIAGRWRYLEYDEVFEAGSYVYEEADSVHTLKVPDDVDGPTIVLFVVSQGQEILDADGELMSVETGETIDGYYRAALEEVGLSAPASLRA
jgi:quercetin dioxygenase-like cupin family protein